jgi:hypothetical protein
MFRDYKKEVDAIIDDLSAALQMTMASKQFSATILLVAVQLSLLERKIGETKNLTERRNHIHEYNRAKRAIQNGIKRLKDSRPKTHTASRCVRRTLP